ncbi:MAG: CatB-related O-acetyltransferase [Bacteroidales bacterium]|nr:CatB-related O-acetyltransferase [Bacteroidales bacterium]
MTDLNHNEFDSTVVFHANTNVVNSKFEGYNFVGQGATVAYSEFGKYSYISKNSVIKNTKVGRFSSISWNCSIGPEDHDFNRLTSSSVLTSIKTFTLFDHKFYNPFEKECSIGNDCWIGCNSTILRGVKIPDGVVIGANSVVTHCPPPYSVIVGSPARVLKMRFCEEIIKKLLEIKWWNYKDATIKQLEPLFAKSELTIDDVLNLQYLLQNIES